MDKKSFQNGFICGMATKGLVRSGEAYKPVAWNDDGVFSYFYIDFRRGLKDFSLGMWQESILTCGPLVLPSQGIELVGEGVYKVYSDISQGFNGISVVNKKDSLLNLKINAILPVFSIMFYVAGLETYVKKAYIYEKSYTDIRLPRVAESLGIIYSPTFLVGTAVDSITIVVFERIVAESVNISYWDS